MLRVALKIVLAAAALAAVWAFVPIGGHTMAWRWERAADPGDFVDRTWAELRGQARPPQHPRPPARAQARGGAAATRPSEAHSEADRRELDRILSRHLDERK
jgi:hypothetical protein